MLTACPIFVELCAGSAAVTLRLLSANARPPISYMGAKTGYAQAILHVLGLRSGQGAAACVLVEAGPWARAWRLLTTPEGCRAVAAVIRGWIGEDARALWERLRSEPTPEGEAEEVGAWMVTQAWNANSGPVDARQGYRGPGGNLGMMGSPQTLLSMADHSILLSSLSWPPVQVVEGDVTEVDPREVARWLYTGNLAYRRGYPESGFNEAISVPSRWLDRHGNEGLSPATTAASTADAVDDSLVPWPPTIVSNAPVQDVAPGVLPPGTVVYFDPPYAGTTGYQAKLTRAQVLTVAQRWADAGATVCVSEAEPLPLPGWHHVEITGTRIGQKRTFSKQQHEWLTLNREPAWLPETQGTLGLEAIA